MQHPETDKDIPGSDHCFALVPLLCSGAARTTSLRIDEKDRRRVCLTSQKISPLLLPPSLIHSLRLAGCRPLAGWLFCWDPLPYFLHSLCYRATKQAKKMLVKLGQMRTLSPNSLKFPCAGKGNTGWHSRARVMPLGKAWAPTVVWCLNSWYFSEIKVNAIKKWGQRQRTKCGLLLLVTAEYLHPMYHWLLAMKKPGKDIWPPECLGLSINNKQAYQRAPFLTAQTETKVLCKRNAPERRLRTVLVQAKGTGREKRKRKSLAFLSRNLILRAETL